MKQQSEQQSEQQSKELNQLQSIEGFDCWMKAKGFPAEIMDIQTL